MNNQFGDKIIKRGDTDSFSINFLDENKAPIDLTGWTVWFTVRNTPADTLTQDDNDALISKKYTNLDKSGSIVVELSETETNKDAGTYYYDIQFKDKLGNISSTDTYRFIIKNDITRSE